MPCVATTEGSGLQPGKWIRRLLELRMLEGSNGAWLFKRRLKPPHMQEFSVDFFRVFQEIQATTDFIDKDIDITETFGMARSLRRGFTTHARNMRISLDDIRAMN